MLSDYALCDVADSEFILFEYRHIFTLVVDDSVADHSHTVIAEGIPEHRERNLKIRKRHHIVILRAEPDGAVKHSRFIGDDALC